MSGQPRGPWWLTSFRWQGRECVVRFKIAGDAVAGWRPGRMELCAFPTEAPPPARAKREAAERFIAAHLPIIADAHALAAGEPATGVFA